MGTIAVLLLVAVLLPTVAQAAQEAIPMLVGLLVVLALVGLAWPTRRRR